MRQLFPEKSALGTSQHAALKTATLSATQWQMMDRGDICKAPRIFGGEVTPLVGNGVCAALCLVDVTRLECVSVPACVHLCPLMSLYECLACRGGWSGLGNILCDSTSGRASLAFDVPPLITATPGLFIHRALVHSASPADNACFQPQRAEREKKKQIQKKALKSLKNNDPPPPKDHCDILTKLWLEGSNDVRRR